jgi:hypothetical protein
MAITVWRCTAPQRFLTRVPGRSMKGRTNDDPNQMDIHRLYHWRSSTVDIPHDGNWVTAELAPAVPDALLLLIVKADPAGAHLTFKVNDPAAKELPLL